MRKVIGRINNMGNKVSKPARKLGKSVVNADDLLRSSRAKLPPQSLRDQFEKRSGSGPDSGPESGAQRAESELGSERAETESKSRSEGAVNAHSPQGRDGMDPSADQGFINSINRLGRQVETHSANNPAKQQGITALKQLSNRKHLFEIGQKEVDQQMTAEGGTRTMIHPRTLTAVLNALKEDNGKFDNVMKDFSVEKSLLEGLGRFKVADNLVVMEEKLKEDEIGPKNNLPLDRRSHEDIPKDGAEEDSRIRQLKKRLE